MLSPDQNHSFTSGKEIMLSTSAGKSGDRGLGVQVELGNSGLIERELQQPRLLIGFGNILKSVVASKSHLFRTLADRKFISVLRHFKRVAASPSPTPAAVQISVTAVDQQPRIVSIIADEPHLVVAAQSGCRPVQATMLSLSFQT
ncbi:hypothetical protein F0562_019452 [Nyssa sinensis]|uniref:Uncharacterized protein n=1 Tax=Nyssa sinensis TaxID=561372 RepID=A0A5J5BSJ8_9ASTE|nr:hypothetical protein F0562_019452 [Nyssa sinensis]